MRAANEPHLENYDPQRGTVLSIAKIYRQWTGATVARHGEHPGVVHLLSTLDAEILQNIYELCSYRRIPSAIIIEVSRAAQTEDARVDSAE